MNTKNSRRINIPFYSAFALLALGCWAFLPTVEAVSPAPDGGYAGNNTAEGTSALFSLTSGSDNTGLGFQALYRDTTGYYNTGIGYRALFGNTTGAYNTAAGLNALLSNTTGSFNTAVGINALYYTNASYNTAAGFDALFNNTTGVLNTAMGVQALFSNITGVNSVAVGETALYRANSDKNVAIGDGALYSTTTGTQNIGLGHKGGYYITTGNYNIDIGNQGTSSDAGMIRIGTDGANTGTLIAGIAGVNEGGTIIDPVYINQYGQLGTYPAPSSRRFKKDIRPMNKTSEAILALKPVTFCYKNDPKDRPQFGLVAEEVAKVNPDLVVSDRNGEIYSVRYDAMNVMLLNEFLKEHRRVQEQETKIAQLQATVGQQQKDFRSAVAEQQKEIQTLTASLKEQKAQIEKVSYRLNRTPLLPLQVNTP